MDESLPDSSVHGILQARILEWVAGPPPGDLPNPGIKPTVFYISALAGGSLPLELPWKSHLSSMAVLWLSHVLFFEAPWTVTCQTPLSMEFSRQEYWSELPPPSPGDLPKQGLNPGLQDCKQSPALQSVSWPTEPLRKLVFLLLVFCLVFLPSNFSSSFLQPPSLSLCLN